MFARFSTFNAQTSAIDAGIAYVRDEVMTKMQHMEGFVGLSLLVDRSTGRCIATSAWHDENAMRMSATAADALRARGGEILGAVASVEEYEIAVMHRAHRAVTGSMVRGTFCHGDPADVDQMIDMFKYGTLAKIEDLSGFSSASLFVNRGTGRACASVTYDTRAALEATRMDANGIRTQAMSDMRATLDEVHEFELAFARLHVPEMA